MRKGKRNVLAVIVMAAAGGGLVAGCSVGTPTVPKHNVENKVATILAKQENQPVPKVVCPGDLTGKIGTVMYCSLTAQGENVSYPVKLQVNSINGNTVNFHIQVSTTPGHFTG